LLEYHGTVVEDLLHGTLRAWNRQISKEMRFLKKHCNKIFIGGSSFGGNLALIYASKNKVDGILSYATPIFWRRERILKTLATITNQFKLFQKKKYRKEDLHIVSKKVHYQKLPLPTLFQVLRAATVTRRKLRKIKDPILIVQSTTDHIVDKRTAGHIYDNVSSKKKRLLWIDNSYHVVLVDKKRNMTFNETYEFIKKN
jgi:carboxylesterase